MTRSNIVYYNIYIDTIRTWNIVNLIFVDESHFDRRDLCSKYGWSVKGSPNIYIDQSSLDSYRFCK